MANSKTMKSDYWTIADSILTNMANWGKDMKYLIPGLAIFLVTFIFKYPEAVQQHTANIL